MKKTRSNTTMIEQTHNQVPQEPTTDSTVAAFLRTLTLCLDQLLNRESGEAITYDGDEPAAHFFSQLESQPNFHKLEPARQARKVLSSLRGEPRKIAQDLALLNKTYEEVKESLCAVYPRRPSFTLQEFYELKCTSKAEIENYYKNKVRIGLAINLPKSAIVQALSNGVPRNYGNLLKMAQPSGPEEWLCLAQQLTYERDNTSTKAAQQRSPRQSRAPSTTVDKTPPYPCRYCGGQHWHAQCQQRGPYQRTFRTFTPAVHNVEQPQRSTGPAGVYETAATTSSGETNRALRSYERNYTISELECLAIVECVDKFRVYLLGTRFVIYSDHHALQWLKTIKDPTGRLFRWSLRLSAYDYEVKYLKGSRQYEADLLSRNPFCGFLSTGQIKDNQGELQRDTRYILNDKDLMTITRWGVTKIIVPPSLRGTLLQRAHRDFNHPGISQMTRLIAAQYYWDGMTNDIRTHERTCSVCQLVKPPKGPIYGELGQLPPAVLPYELVSLDTISGFAKYGNSQTFLHVVVDHATRKRAVLFIQKNFDHCSKFKKALKDFPTTKPAYGSMIRANQGSIDDRFFHDYSHKNLSGWTIKSSCYSTRDIHVGQSIDSGNDLELRNEIEFKFEIKFSVPLMYSEEEENIYDSEDETSSQENEVSMEFEIIRSEDEAKFEFTFDVLSTDQVMQTMNQTINEVYEILKIPPTLLRILLNHFNWDLAKFYDRYYGGDQRSLFEDAHMVNPLENLRPPINGTNERPSIEECEICFLEFPSNIMTGIGCGHKFCQECWKEYLTTKIMHDGMGQKISCQASECDILVDYQTVMNLIEDEKVKQRYQQLIINSYVAYKDKLRWCPSPDCNNVIRVQSVESRPVTCNCSHTFCFGCVIEKNGGCNHMMCRNPNCRTHFCWICLGPWESHKDNYKCNQFKEEDSAALDDQEKSKAALNKYFFYSVRYMNHLQSQKLEKKLNDTVETKIKEMNKQKVAWVDSYKLRQCLDVLCQCRQTLMYSYAFAYYLKKNNQCIIFEENQRDLETATEKISEYLERDLSVEENNRAIIKMMTLSRKRRKLYAFFVDVKKAFDTVPHSLLWKKLTVYGLSTRFISLIQSYYNQMSATIRWNGSLTEFIKIQAGVLQDDIILLGESKINLQKKKINVLRKYFEDNFLTLNQSKSKVMVFRNGGRKPDRMFGSGDNCLSL
ncbi:ARIH1 [Cordylochernes scorpioides]|uniref:RNA-directed DNA polymerase n=1 Tax=Cordylochernes scorpioides TaxID=51811 RepID=A0ABY6LBG2_9ARAC|nr:ARIH1 [Cordylochernes scorpioides]